LTALRFLELFISTLALLHRLMRGSRSFMLRGLDGEGGDSPDRCLVRYVKSLWQGDVFRDGARRQEPEGTSGRGDSGAASAVEICAAGSQLAGAGEGAISGPAPGAAATEHSGPWSCGSDGGGAGSGAV